MHDDRWTRTPDGRRLLEALREACGRLPEVEEITDGFGHRTFRVRTKSFVIAGMGEDGTHLAIKSDPVNQSLLTRREPYFRTPYIGQHGWISVASPLDHDWAEIEALILEAWRLAAPKRLVDRLQGD
jgi:predicted DNA-binding protein (MmcQ/YjbR family)